MRIETIGQQLEVTPALKDYVDTKLERLGRHFTEKCDVTVRLSVEKPDHKVSADVKVVGQTIHANAEGQTMYAAIDGLADKLDRLVIKHKEKKQAHAPVSVRDNIV